MRKVKPFDKNDWNHFHDCILEATWKTSKINASQEQMEELFKSLPDNLKHMAYQWGMSDTVFRDDCINHLIDNNVLK